MQSPDAESAAEDWPAEGLSLKFAPPALFDASFRRMSVGLLLGLALGLYMSWGSGESGSAAGFMILVAAAAAYAVVVAVRIVGTDREGPTVRLLADHAELPLSARSRRTRRVAYRDILSLATHGAQDGARRWLVIGTRARVYTYPEHAFETPGAISILRHALMARIAALPDGAEVLSQFDQRVRVAIATERRRPVVTRAIVATVVAAFILQQVYLQQSAAPHMLSMIRLGANFALLVQEGQVFRLFSSNFLHGGMVHVLMNTVALLSLGIVLERILGPARVLLVFLVSGVGGALTSALLGPGLSVGVSTAVFGLLGALGWVNLKYGAELPLGPRQPLRWWVIILGINALLPVIIPLIDWAAHLGGLVVGVVVAQLMVFRKPMRMVLAPASPAVLRLARLALAIYVVALFQAVTYALETDEAAVARQLNRAGLAADLSEQPP